MAKLTREQKIEIYEKRKKGISFSKLSKEYNIRKDNIQYLCRLIDRHGIDILRKDKNIKYSKTLKEEIINQVLFNMDYQVMDNFSIGLNLIKKTNVL